MAMALSKLSRFKTLITKPPSPLPISLLRLLSFATPEEAAAERRRRHLLLRLQSPTTTQAPNPKPNPNAPKFPDKVAALSGDRLALHNRILTLLRAGDLHEAALYARHAVYSNCRPSIFTCNAVMAALLRRSCFSDVLSLHRFISQAGIAGNLVTHNILISVYCESRKLDTAVEYYKRLVDDAPFNPSPTTYRILIRALVENRRIERAIQLKDEMNLKGLSVDPAVYGYLMNGCAKVGDSDGIFRLYEELKEKLGGIRVGIVYGGLMKGYFLKGEEEEAMRVYNEVISEDSRTKMGALAYDFVLDALCENGKFEEALRLFGRMKEIHNPPRTIAIDLESYKVISGGYCDQRRFTEAIDVFMSCNSPDASSFNGLIGRLCDNGALAEAEELCVRMVEKEVKPDESTHALLMDACFKENRPDDASRYFMKMIDENLNPGLEIYNKLVDGLVEAGKIDEAKSYFDMMAGKIKMNSASYEFMFRALCDVGRVDEVLKMAGDLVDGGSDFNADMERIIKEGLRKAGRDEEEVVKLVAEKEREKEEARKREAEEAERAKESAKAAVASLLPLGLFGNRGVENEAAAVAGNLGQSGFSGEARVSGDVDGVGGKSGCGDGNGGG